MTLSVKFKTVLTKFIHEFKDILTKSTSTSSNFSWLEKALCILKLKSDFFKALHMCKNSQVLFKLC